MFTLAMFVECRFTSLALGFVLFVYLSVVGFARQLYIAYLSQSVIDHRLTLRVSCININRWGTALWHHHYTVPASCVFWLPSTLHCSLCTVYLEQYTCCQPRFWHLGHLQNWSQNSPLQLRLQATPLTAIHWHLRFILPWHYGAY